jgi:hypothetical protein
VFSAVSLGLAPEFGGATGDTQPAAPAKEALPERAVALLGESRFQNFGRVFSLAFSPDGKFLAAGSWDGFLTWWDLVTRRPLREWEAHPGPVTTLAIAPDGQTVASAGREGEIRVWGTADARLRTTLAGHKASVQALTFSPGGKLLASGDWKGALLWDLGSGRRLHEFKGGRAPTFSVDGSTLSFVRWYRPEGVRAHAGDLLRVEVPTGKERERLALPPGPWDRHALSASGRWLVRAGALPLRIRELPSGRESGPEEKWTVSATGLALAPNERCLAVAGADQRILVIELATGQVRCHFRGSGRVETALAFSPDGRLLASGGLDRTVLLWDLTGRMSKGRLSSIPLPAAELARLWKDLEAADGGTAHRAIWELTAGARDSVPFLDEQLQPRAPADPEPIARWIGELRDGPLQARTRALRELEGLHDEAEPLLRKSLATSPSLEFRRRVEKLLLQIDVWWAKQWRLVRAVEVMEQVASPEARQILRRLADSGAGPRLAAEARYALGRLARGAGGADEPPRGP